MVLSGFLLAKMDHRKKLPLIVLGFLVLCIVTKVKSDLSVENCVAYVDEDVIETTTSVIVSTTDKTIEEIPIRTAKPPIHTDGSPRPDQKSLLIVFDGTNSMRKDLEQLLGAAREIVKTLAALEEKPIYNYILSVYRDPG